MKKECPCSSLCNVILWILSQSLAILIGLSLNIAVAHAQKPAGVQKKPTHALVIVAKVATAPVTHPKRSLKDVLGSVLFATENIVDVMHGGFNLADKTFDALSIQGKVPVLDEVYGFVSIANTDSGKLDSWLERQETYLFGTHN